MYYLSWIRFNVPASFVRASIEVHACLDETPQPYRVSTTRISRQNHRMPYPFIFINPAKIRSARQNGTHPPIPPIKVWCCSWISQASLQDGGYVFRWLQGTLYRSPVTKGRKIREVQTNHRRELHFSVRWTRMTYCNGVHERFRCVLFTSRRWYLSYWIRSASKGYYSWANYIGIGLRLSQKPGTSQSLHNDRMARDIYVSHCIYSYHRHKQFMKTYQF